MTYKYKLVGRVPSKKNSRVVNTWTGKNFPNNKYRQWHKSASYQLMTQKQPESPLERVNSITVVFYPPDKRKFDLTNKAESIMDLLVDNNILQDDNYEIVPMLILKIAEVVKDGFTEISISI